MRIITRLKVTDLTESWWYCVTCRRPGLVDVTMEVQNVSGWRIRAAWARRYSQSGWIWEVASITRQFTQIKATIMALFTACWLVNRIFCLFTAFHLEHASKAWGFQHQNPFPSDSMFSYPDIWCLSFQNKVLTLVDRFIWFDASSVLWYSISKQFML